MGALWRPLVERIRKMELLWKTSVFLQKIKKSVNQSITKTNELLCFPETLLQNNKNIFFEIFLLIYFPQKYGSNRWHQASEHECIKLHICFQYTIVCLHFLFTFFLFTISQVKDRLKMLILSNLITGHLSNMLSRLKQVSAKINFFRSFFCLFVCLHFATCLLLFLQNLHNSDSNSLSRTTYQPNFKDD